jgi:CRP-like cAMP-binding protein
MTMMEAETLIGLPVFAGLRLDQLQRLAPLLGPVHFGAGDTVFASGCPSRRLFIILSGEVSLYYRPYDGTEMEIGKAHAKDAIGWSAVLRRAVCTSTAICRTDVEALAIVAEDLRRLMCSDKALGTRLMENIGQLAANRIEGLGQQVIRLLHTSAGRPVGSDGDPGR